jgi:hypothetical protein
VPTSSSSGSSISLCRLTSLAPVRRAACLPQTPQWGLAHPQGDASGSERIEQLAEYRAAFTVWSVAKRSGERPTKLLVSGDVAAGDVPGPATSAHHAPGPHVHDSGGWQGRTWVRRVFPEVRAQLLTAQEQEPPGGQGPTATLGEEEPSATPLEGFLGGQRLSRCASL